VWVDRQGKEQPASVPARAFRQAPRFSPDGTRIAFEIGDEQGVDVWLHELARPGSLTRLTFGGFNTVPVWTPDSKRLIYASRSNANRSSQDVAIRSAPADSSSQPVTLLTSQTPAIPLDVSPDGKMLLGRWPKPPGGTELDGKRDKRFRRGEDQDLWLLPLGPSSETKGPEVQPRNFLATPFDEIDAMFSPDGRWVAYVSNDTPRNEIYVVPYPGPGAKTQVSIDGGGYPVWNRNGRELFFRSGNKMMAVEVQTGATFRAGTPKVLFEGAYSNFYDVSPDGRRFLMLKSDAPREAPPNELHVVVNWFEELRRRVPLGK
jgi:Tol biopolymer transport system component